jgi:hypothetical protein
MSKEIKGVKFVDSPKESSDEKPFNQAVELIRLKQKVSGLTTGLHAVSIIQGVTFAVTLLYFFTH